MGIFDVLTGCIDYYEHFEERDKIVESSFSSYKEERDYIDKCEDFARAKYFKIVGDTIRNGRLIYDLLVLRVCQEFDIEADCCMPNCVYGIVNYYLDNEIMMEFDKWLRSSDGPVIADRHRFMKMFPEFRHMSMKQGVALANKIYSCDFKLDYGDDYVYSNQFNYSIKHIDIKCMQELKVELDFCKKYGVALAQDSVEKLHNLGLDNETINKIFDSL